MLLLGVIGAATLPAAAADVAHVDATSSWTVYHGDPLGTGADPSGVTFSPPNPAWTSPVLDGQVYGEPLEATGRVFVATENDTIYALAADTGAILWSTHVGTPVPSEAATCCRAVTSSQPVGITGTPVVDAARGRDLRRGRRAERTARRPTSLSGCHIYNGTSMMDPARWTRRDRIRPTSCSARG